MWLRIFKEAAIDILKWIAQVFPRPAYDVDPKDLPMNQPPEPQKPPVEAPKPEKVVLPTFKWDTPENARHSVRVICDEMGLTLYEKNLICACIMQESNFKNTAVGKNIKDGKLLSTDWGICQINDYWHVGKGKYWPSVESIVNNPEKAVRWMITLYKQGQLKLWVSYSSGAYKKYMP